MWLLCHDNPTLDVSNKGEPIRRHLTSAQSKQWANLTFKNKIISIVSLFLGRAWNEIKKCANQHHKHWKTKQMRNWKFWNVKTLKEKNDKHYPICFHLCCLLYWEFVCKLNSKLLPKITVNTCVYLVWYCGFYITLARWSIDGCRWH